MNLFPLDIEHVASTISSGGFSFLDTIPRSIIRIILVLRPIIGQKLVTVSDVFAMPKPNLGYMWRLSGVLRCDIPQL